MTNFQLQKVREAEHVNKKTRKTIQVQMIQRASMRYQIDKVVEDYETFLIDNEVYKAQTYCFNVYEGDPVKFIEGTPGICVSAKLLVNDKVCNVWCE